MFFFFLLEESFQGGCGEGRKFELLFEFLVLDLRVCQVFESLVVFGFDLLEFSFLIVDTLLKLLEELCLLFEFLF